MKNFVLLVSILLVVLAGGCAGPRVSASDQSLLKETDQLHARLRGACVEEQSPRLKRYFEQIEVRITAAAKELDQQGLIHSSGEGAGVWMFSKDLDLHLVVSDLPGSFTSGGRHLYVYNNLFQQCRSEDELASLFCHEFAHVYARHVQQEIKRDPAVTGDNALIYPYATLRNSAALEKSADSIAFTIYVKGGWDPTRFASLEGRMAAAKIPGVDSVLLKEKINEAARRVDSLPPAAREWMTAPVADEARFAQLLEETQTAIAQIKPAEKVQLLLASFPGPFSSGETAVQAKARQRLFPAPAQGDNPWGKGLPGK